MCSANESATHKQIVNQEQRALYTLSPRCIGCFNFIQLIA